MCGLYQHFLDLNINMYILKIYENDPIKESFMKTFVIRLVKKINLTAS